MFNPRSLLFVPANRPDRFARASGTPADALILDLEDSVGVIDKVSSRENLAQAAQPARTGAAAVFVRVNPVDTPWHVDDLAAAVEMGARGVVVPKAEDPAVIADIEAQLSAFEAGRDALELIVIVETAAGVLAVDRLAVPAARTRRVAFGAYDFALDMGVRLRRGLSGIYRHSSRQVQFLGLVPRRLLPGGGDDRTDHVGGPVVRTGPLLRRRARHRRLCLEVQPPARGP